MVDAVDDAVVEAVEEIVDEAVEESVGEAEGSRGWLFLVYNVKTPHSHQAYCGCRGSHCARSPPVSGLR